MYKLVISKNIIRATIILTIALICGSLFLWISVKKDEVKNQVSGKNFVFLNKSDTDLVKKGTVSKRILFTGNLVPVTVAAISSIIDAQVLKVNVRVGEYVRQGQILAILDDKELQQSVIQMQAALDLSKAKLILDENKLHKHEVLLKEGFISQIAYKELYANYQISLESVKQQQALFKKAQQQLLYTKIKAPFAGVIYRKSIDDGQIASKNNELFGLANLDFLQVKVPIPSMQINEIQIGQLATFRVETSAQKYTARVTYINPVAEADTHSYMAYIDFNNKVFQLKAGQFVQGNIVVQSLTNVTYITNQAIRYTNSIPYVLIVRKNKLYPQKIKVLLYDDEHNYYAISGVHVNDIIVLNNILNVKPYTNVKLNHE